jgi:hypothetical protein
MRQNRPPHVHRQLRAEEETLPHPGLLRGPAQLRTGVKFYTLDRHLWASGQKDEPHSGFPEMDFFKVDTYFSKINQGSGPSRVGLNRLWLFTLFLQRIHTGSC